MFTDPKGLGIGAIAAGNISVNPLQKISINPSTPYRVDLEVLAQISGRTLSIDIAWYDSSNIYLTTSAAVTGLSGANTITPVRLSGVFTSHSSAAYASVAIRMSGAMSVGEWVIVLASPRPRFAAI